MIEGLDHLVVAVKDLAAAARSYTEAGFAVVTGGRHPESTHNALISFADGSYIELLAFYEPSPKHRWWGALERGGGLIDFCLASSDLASDSAAFRRAGVTITDPEPGARARPDGVQLRWQLAKPEGAFRGVAPFLIHDETPRSERVPRPAAHVNRVSGVGTVTVAVADARAATLWYESAVGRKGQAVRRDLLYAGGDLPPDSGDPDHVELVEIRAEDREEFDALEQRVSRVERLVENTGVEREPAQFAVDVKGRIECHVCLIP